MAAPVPILSTTEPRAGHRRRDRSSPMSRSRLSEGEFLGIIGPNGAGKTSLFNLLSGLYRPTTGRIELDGREITHQPPVPAHARGAGQDVPDLERLPAADGARERSVGCRVGLGGTLRIWRRAAAFRCGARPCSLGARTGRALAARGKRRPARSRMGTSGSSSWPCSSPATRASILLDEPMAGVSSGRRPGLVEVIRSCPRARRGRRCSWSSTTFDVVTGRRRAHRSDAPRRAARVRHAPKRDGQQDGPGGLPR